MRGPDYVAHLACGYSRWRAPVCMFGLLLPFRALSELRETYVTAPRLTGTRRARLEGHLTRCR